MGGDRVRPPACVKRVRSLRGWYDPDYRGCGPDLIARPKLAPAYPGIRRVPD